MPITRFCEAGSYFSTGVMMIVTALFIGTGTIAFLIPIVAGVCLILSAIFAKKAEEKEQKADE